MCASGDAKPGRGRAPLGLWAPSSSCSNGRLLGPGNWVPLVSLTRFLLPSSLISIIAPPNCTCHGLNHLPAGFLQASPGQSPTPGSFRLCQNLTSRKQPQKRHRALPQCGLKAFPAVTFPTLFPTLPPAFGSCRSELPEPAFPLQHAASVPLHTREWLSLPRPSSRPVISPPRSTPWALPTRMTVSYCVGWLCVGACWRRSRRRWD